MCSSPAGPVAFGWWSGDADQAQPDLHAGRVATASTPTPRACDGQPLVAHRQRQKRGAPTAGCAHTRGDLLGSSERRGDRLRQLVIQAARGATMSSTESRRSRSSSEVPKARYERASKCAVEARSPKPSRKLFGQLRSSRSSGSLTGATFDPTLPAPANQANLPATGKVDVTTKCMLKTTLPESS